MLEKRKLAKQRFLGTAVKALHTMVAQSVEHRTLEVEVPGSKTALSTWWWGRISPNQPYPKGAAPAATTSLNKW